MANKLAVFGLVLLSLVIFVAAFAPWIAPQDPCDVGKRDIFDSKLPPGSQDAAGTMSYWLGTGGQAAQPHKSVDTIVIAARMVGVLRTRSTAIDVLGAPDRGLFCARVIFE
jgi:peptide/nickel transport system permease protein